MSTARIRLSSAGQAGRPQTLGQTVSVAGIGLHSGRAVTCTLQPAPAGHGRRFVRGDLGPRATIPARLEWAQARDHTTVLSKDGVTVGTVEHLLAALASLGVDHCEIVLDGPELPILDGSAAPFVEAILSAGRVPCGEAAREVRCVERPTIAQAQGVAVIALPATECRLTYGVDYEDSPIRQQWFSFCVSGPAGEAAFVEQLAPARTFARLGDVRQAQAAGLIRGGTLDAALVCTAEGWLGARPAEAEPARHKLLDLIGDLSLGPWPLKAHIIAFKAGHTLHLELARLLMAQI